jgi:hypothetical protein
LEAWIEEPDVAHALARVGRSGVSDL